MCFLLRWVEISSFLLHILVQKYKNAIYIWHAGVFLKKSCVLYSILLHSLNTLLTWIDIFSQVFIALFFYLQGWHRDDIDLCRFKSKKIDRGFHEILEHYADARRRRVAGYGYDVIDRFVPVSCGDFECSSCFKSETIDRYVLLL